MITTLRSFVRDESGATAIEYGLIAALVSVAAIAALGALGTSLSNIFTFVSDELGNAVNGVMQFVPRPCEQDTARKISADEKRILTGIAHGKDMADIADEAAVSALPLRSKIDHIVKKVGARNISHAVVLSLIEGEISLEELSPT